MKKKINIGLDIGVASVGWSIIEEQEDKTFKILDLGVRLFNDVANPKDGSLQNEKRRSSRSMRRRLTRIRTRKASLKKLFIKYGLANSEKEIDELIDQIDITKFGYNIPSELKLEGLKSKFKENWLNKTIFCLFHYIHHRGYFWLTDEDYEKLKLENEEISNKLPSERIVDFYNKNGYYKGSNATNVSAKEWMEEICLFLKIQNLDNNFAKEYLELFKKTRDFSVGPGSEKSPTPYGLFQYNELNEVVKIGENLWDFTIGKCSFYKDEKRGGKNSIIAEIFNFLNDLSNIYFDNNTTHRLTLEEINNIRNSINNKINSSKQDIKLKITPKNIMEWAFNKEDAENKLKSSFGFRVKITKKNDSEKIITDCNNYIQLIKWIKTLNIDKYKKIDFFDINFINEMNDIFFFYFSQKDVIKRNESIRKFIQETYNINYHENNFPKLDGISQSHSLSYKAMVEYIDYFLKNIGKNIGNWTQYSNEINKQKASKETTNYKYIPNGIFNDAIISPTVRRSFNQTITILNKIIEKYCNEYDIHHITIELAREKNTVEQAKLIKKYQSLRTELNKSMKNEFDIQKDFSSAQILRYRLYKEQEGKDIYTGDYIDKESILTGVGLDIDHIIPYSIINDDSFENKVLCFKNNNFDKKNQTPYQWLEKSGRYNSFKEKVEKLNISSKKKNLLLFEGDPLSIENGFVGRNLVDTRYATVLIMNTLKEFFKNNTLYNDNKPIINVIRGSVTSYTRNQIFSDSHNILTKDRDDYRHHAIDASIVAFLGSNHTINKKLSFIEKYNNSTQHDNWLIKENKLINNYNGEIIDLDSFIDKGEKTVLNFKEQLLKYNDNQNKDVKFSRLLLNKNNVQISNETIYKVKWHDNTFSKGNKITYINIMEETKELDKYFSDDAKDANKLICFEKDKTLYNKLKTIYDQYLSKEQNPFIAYMQDNYSELSEIDSDNLEKNKKQKATFKFLKLDEHTRIKKLRICGDEITNEKVILLSKHKNKKSDNFNPPILESLNMLEARIYKNKNDKYITCPLNIKLLKYDKKENKMIIDNEKLDKWLEINNVVEKDKFITLKNGIILINKNTNELFYSIGSTTKVENSYIVEIKLLNKEPKKNLKGIKQRFNYTISTLIERFDLCDIDPLGKIYNRREIKL